MRTRFVLPILVASLAAACGSDPVVEPPLTVTTEGEFEVAVQPGTTASWERRILLDDDTTWAEAEVTECREQESATPVGACGEVNVRVYGVSVLFTGRVLVDTTDRIVVRWRAQGR